MKRLLLAPLLIAGLLSPIAAKSDGKIPDYVLTPYDRANYPSYFKKFGSRMKDIEKYRGIAAKKAASNKQCALVKYAEVSRDKSTKNNLLFWVDCEKPSGGYPYKRFNFTEADLNNPDSLVISNSDRALTETQSLDACEQLIKSKANYPSTVKVNRFTATYKMFEHLGNTRTIMNFKSKNAFGLELKFTAYCTFRPGDLNGDLVVKERTN